MKIQGDDFDHLRDALLATLKAHNLHPFMVNDTAQAWQVFHKAWAEGRLNGNDLYKRYHDAHFDTALKAIFKKGVQS
jgi:hypothetical protein